jgi:hypothetical protein
MKNNYIISSSIWLVLTVFGFWSCSTDNVYEPMDIISGNVDIEEIYYRNKFEIPVEISGSIKNLKTTEPIAGAIITAKVNGSSVEYTTLSEADGSYSLYIEGSEDYILFVTKEGYDRKNYYSYYLIDTINSFSYNTTIDFDLMKPVSAPLFYINYLSTRYLNENLTDLTYNGSELMGIYLSKIFCYNQDGSLNKSYYLKNSGMDIFGSQDTVFWVASDESTRSISKVGQKGGALISAVTCQIPTVIPVDIEVLNNNIWLMTRSDLYELSYTGDQVSHVSLSELVPDLNLVGLAKLDDCLYLLNKETIYDNLHKGYSLYKYNPVSGQIITKGYFPDTFDSYALKGLATDGNYFWTINIANSTDEVIKLELVHQTVLLIKADLENLPATAKAKSGRQA